MTRWSSSDWRRFWRSCCTTCVVVFVAVLGWELAAEDK